MAFAGGPDEAVDDIRRERERTRHRLEASTRSREIVVSKARCRGMPRRSAGADDDASVTPDWRAPLTVDELCSLRASRRLTATRWLPSQTGARGLSGVTLTPSQTTLTPSQTGARGLSVASERHSCSPPATSHADATTRPSPTTLRAGHSLALHAHTRSGARSTSTLCRATGGTCSSRRPQHRARPRRLRVGAPPPPRFQATRSGRAHSRSKNRSKMRSWSLKSRRVMSQDSLTRPRR